VSRHVSVSTTPISIYPSNDRYQTFGFLQSRVLLRSFLDSIKSPDLPKIFRAKSTDTFVSSTLVSSTQNCFNSPASTSFEIPASSTSPCAGLQNLFAIFERLCVVYHLRFRQSQTKLRQSYLPFCHPATNPVLTQQPTTPVHLCNTMSVNISNQLYI